MMLGGVLSLVKERGGLRPLVWGSIAVGLALALDFVPLFDLLGYDFSFVMGLLAALAAVDVGAGVVSRARRRGRPSVGVFNLAGQAVAWSTGILVPPLLVSLLNALRVRNCNLPSGLGFYLLLPVGTALFGSSAGVLCAWFFARRGRALAFALPVLSIFWTLLRLYFDPPVFAYDPFGGYFPGPIYDEALRPSLTLLVFRLCNLIWIGTALTIAWAGSAGPPPPGPQSLHGSLDSQGAREPWAAFRLDVRRWPWRRTSVAALLLVLSAVLFGQRAALGFHLGRAELRQVLDGERRSEHVILRYATAAGTSASDLDLTVEDLAFRYDQLHELFGVEPSGPITVYQFASGEEKKALVGAGSTLYAKPWTREIFVQAEPFPSHRLRHEMAHVFAASFGDPIFGVALRVRWKGPLPLPRLASGLIEGIAEAADFTDPDGTSTTHQEAAAIIADGRGAPLGALMGAGFSIQSGPRAYTLAGSFTRYLLDTRGAEKLEQIYRSAGDFPGVYGTSLAALESEWHAFLSRQPLSTEQRARAREQFRRPAIFQKICAREQATRIGQARVLLGVAPRRAIELLQRACSDDPSEPSLQIELAQALAVAGDSRASLLLLGEIARQPDLTAPLRAHAANLTATIQFHLGSFDETRTALRLALTFATDEGERRQVSARLRALEDEPARRTLGHALFGNNVTGAIDPVVAFSLFSDFARLHPDEALGPYLLGRQLAFRDSQLAIPLLGQACEGGLPGRALPTDFRRECLRMLMLAAFRAGDLRRSGAAARTLGLESTEEAERLRVTDFLARIAWRKTRPGPP